MNKKVIIFLLVALTLVFASCKKQGDTTSTTTSEVEITEVDVIDVEPINVPESWNGNYALKSHPTVKVLSIKDGKIFQVVSETETEIFPAEAVNNGYAIKITENECSAASDSASFKYTKNADGSISFSKSDADSGVIEYVKM